MAEDLVERVIVATPIAGANAQIIASPFQFFLDGNDNLRIEGWNSLSGVSLQVHGRFFSEAGNVEVFSVTLTLSADRTRTVGDFALAKGYLINLVVTAIGAAPRIGQTFCRVSVIRGLTGATLIMGSVLQGYVTSQQGLAWPGSPIQLSSEGGGYQRAIQGTTPAVGDPCQATVPTGARWRLTAVHVEIQTDANALVRTGYIEYTAAGVHAMWISANPNTAPASTTRQWYWALGNVSSTLVADTTLAPLPEATRMLAGDHFSGYAYNFFAGDAITEFHYAVDEWLEVN